jgi:hypothetical protein
MVCAHGGNEGGGDWLEPAGAPTSARRRKCCCQMAFRVLVQPNEEGLTLVKIKSLEKK